MPNERQNRHQNRHLVTRHQNRHLIVTKMRKTQIGQWVDFLNRHQNRHQVTMTMTRPPLGGRIVITGCNLSSVGAMPMA